MPEFAGPYGVVDLLAITYTGTRLIDRWRSGIPPFLGRLESRLVSAAPSGRAISLEALATRVGRSVQDVRRPVRNLLAAGALVSGDNTLYRRSPLVEPIGRLWALEAKVTDWRKGLGQATQYGLWADASAVVLGRLSVDPDYLSLEARRLGIGVAIQSKWLVRPKLRRQSFEDRLWASEHALAALLTSPSLG